MLISQSITGLSIILEQEWIFDYNNFTYSMSLFKSTRKPFWNLEKVKKQYLMTKSNHISHCCNWIQRPMKLELLQKSLRKVLFIFAELYSMRSQFFVCQSGKL